MHRVLAIQSILRTFITSRVRKLCCYYNAMIILFVCLLVFCFKCVSLCLCLCLCVCNAESACGTYGFISCAICICVFLSISLWFVYLVCWFGSNSHCFQLEFCTKRDWYSSNATGLPKCNGYMTDMLDHCGYWYAWMVDEWKMNQLKTITMGLRFCFKDFVDISRTRFNPIESDRIQSEFFFAKLLLSKSWTETELMDSFCFLFHHQF